MVLNVSNRPCLREGTLISLSVNVGDTVESGQEIAVVEVCQGQCDVAVELLYPVLDLHISAVCSAYLSLAHCLRAACVSFRFHRGVCACVSLCSSPYLLLDRQ